jgi:hypothetical protein
VFTSNSPRARQFRKNARLYNSALQMASSGLRDIAPQQGPSVIAIRGAVHHFLGPLAPAQGQQHQFAQLYIIDDPQHEVQSRIAALGQAGSALDAELLQDLQDCLHNHNTYVRQIKQTKVCSNLQPGGAFLWGCRLDFLLMLGFAWLTDCVLLPCCCWPQDLPDVPEWELVFKTDGSVDRRRYNAPTASEVAGFMPGGCLRPQHQWCACMLFLWGAVS